VNGTGLLERRPAPGQVNLRRRFHRFCTRKSVQAGQKIVQNR
jgi:hypothetical protein